MKTLLTIRRALGFYTDEERLRILFVCAAKQVLTSRDGCCLAVLLTPRLSVATYDDAMVADNLLFCTYGRDANNPCYWWGITFSEEEQEARCLALLLLAEAHADL